MDKELYHHIESLLGTRLKSADRVSGGDIAQAYRLESADSRIFCKLMLQTNGYEVLLAEKAGLDGIRATATIKTPELFGCEQWSTGGFLLMEFLDAKRPSEREMGVFGRQLALLHQKPASTFGWDSNNFIGSLPQSNSTHSNWPEFYVHERLLPQLELAASQGMLSNEEIPSESIMLSVMKELCPEVRPSLVHGDLWSGNYLISADGTPYLIDPAVYRGHSEIDIAMSRLFGGFGSTFYRAYYDVIPEDRFSSDRLKLYQLYYLLVHLNLFGRSYYSGVNAILKSYFY